MVGAKIRFLEKLRLSDALPESFSKPMIDAIMNYAHTETSLESSPLTPRLGGRRIDAYFSADVETDGPIPGPYSILSFALVYAGSFDGEKFVRPSSFREHFYIEMKPISKAYQQEAMNINGLDRDDLIENGVDPRDAMNKAFEWVSDIAGSRSPVLVAYPLSFDWSWLYWYFISFASRGSPFDYSRCFDIKTAFAVKSGRPIAESGRAHLPSRLRSIRNHTHNALDDAVEQAEIFANVFEWDGKTSRT